MTWIPSNALVAHEIAHGVAATLGFNTPRFGIGVIPHEHCLFEQIQAPRADRIAMCGETMAAVIFDGLLSGQIPLNDPNDAGAPLWYAGMAVEIAKRRIATGEEDLDGDAHELLAEARGLSDPELSLAAERANAGALLAMLLFVDKATALLRLGRVMSKMERGELLVLEVNNLRQASLDMARIEFEIVEGAGFVDYIDPLVMQSFELRANLMTW